MVGLCFLEQLDAGHKVHEKPAIIAYLAVKGTIIVESLLPDAPIKSADDSYK